MNLFCYNKTMLDFQILYWLQKLHTPLLNLLFIHITKLGNMGIIWIFLGVILYIFPKTRKLGVGVLLAILLNFVVCDLAIKNLVGRPRPFYGDPTIQLLIPKPKGFSFPSGHTSTAFAAVGFLFFFKKGKYLYFLIPFACLMGISRLYLFVHFPSDVIIGMVLGTLHGYAINQLMRKIQV